MSESFFVKIFDYFFDNTKKLTAKFFILLLVISTLWLIDNVFYFSKNGHYNYKLKQVKEINEILKDSILFSNSELQELKQIRKNILKEEYIFDLKDYYEKIGNELEDNKIKEVETEENKFKELKKSFWYILFSIFLPATLSLFFIGNVFEVLTDKKKRKEFDFRHYLLIFPALFLLLSITYFFYYLGQITPIFFENHLWVNYVYNLYAPILIILIFGLIANQIQELIDKIKK